MDINKIILDIKQELSSIKFRQDKISTIESLNGEYMELEGKKQAYNYVLDLLNNIENE